MEDKKTQTTKNSFGKYIRRTREHQSMSLQDVADVAGITKSHVWDIEKGKTTNPTVKTIMSFAAAFDVEPIDIFHAAMESQL